MSYLFPQTSNLQLGVVQVGSNINVDSNSVISIAQSVEPTANVVFNSISVGSLSVANETVTGNISAGNVLTTGNVYSHGLQTITSVTPSANIGISLSNVVTGGPAASFQINNTGVLSVAAGTGITLSGSTGNVTISATGATIINTKGVSTNYTLTNSDDYVGATVGSITLTLPPGSTGQTFILKNEGGSGAITVSATTPDTIDGAASKSVNSNASISVVFRAGAWRII